MIDPLDSDWWMPTAGHREAAARCLHLLERGSGCGVICGDAGCGKTLVLRRLVRRAARMTLRAFCVDLNGIDSTELRWRLCAGLRLAPSIHESRHQLWSRLSDALEGGRLSRISAAVLFDHADLIGRDALPELRRWLQLAHDQRRTVSIIAARSPIESPLLEILEDFCDLKADVHRLTRDEAKQFIQDWSHLEAPALPLNTDAAREAAHELTGGEPRKLERLCRLAAYASAAESGQPLDRESLDALIRELTSLRSAGSSGIVPRA